jgi:hypothetical protein
MNIDYKEKYLKYKGKYLLAKSLKGGVLTPEQKNIVKENIIRIFNLTIEQLKGLSASVITIKIKQFIDTFDKSDNNSHIYEKISLLYMYLIGIFGTIINDSNKEKFLNAIIEHILNHKINQTQFFSLLQNYKP